MRAIVIAASLAALSGCFPDPDNLPTDTFAPPDDVTGMDAGDLASPSDTTSDAEVRLNVCGGEGLTAPGTPGQPCGDCEDGVWACDPADSEKNRTVCQGASARNACGGCGVIEPPLESPCGECGVVACDNETRLGRCVEPIQGCETFVTCNQLDCESLLRVCDAPIDADASCGDCLAAAEELDGVCTLPPPSPRGVSATTGDSNVVSVTWEAVDAATGYRVEFCDEESCTAEDWELIPNGEVAGVRYDDALAPAPPAPGQVYGLEVTTTGVVSVSLSWSPTDIGDGASRRYRVKALNRGLESLPSTEVSGRRAGRPITGYQVSIDGGAWVDLDIDSAAQGWTDSSAPAPMLTPGGATASEGLYAAYVALSLSGDDATVGATRRYRIRALSDAGAGPASVEVVGYRAAPTTWSVAWERSSGPSPEDFTLISGATTRTYQDTSAPADGSVRYYRARLSAQGVADVYTQPVSGSRLPPPGVPGNVSATTHLEDRVRVTWQTVDGAIGYHVWRDGTKLTTGNGVTSNLFDDTSIAGPSSGWSAPSGVMASTDDPTQVTVSWSAPARPVGPSGSYQVQAVNPSGTSALSGAAAGWRSAAPLSGYEVEIGGQWQETSSLGTSFAHTSAPAGVITVGNVAATRGDHRAHVRLEVSGHAVTPTNVAYRVRGVISTGARTQASASSTGSRAVGALVVQWERSATASSGSSFSAITGATTASFEDAAAPNYGEKRWYRARLSASGADTVTSESAEGWRIAIVKVAVGLRHACALGADGAVWCWGREDNGALGSGSVSLTLRNTPERVEGLGPVTDLSASGTRTCARTDDGRVHCWGGAAALNTNYQWISVGVPTEVPGLATITRLSTGGSLCARAANGTNLCWGVNADGQLGNGSTDATFEPAVTLRGAGQSLGGVSLPAAGVRHNCAVANNAAYCWGLNLDGQIGDGTRTSTKTYATWVSSLSNIVEVSAGLYFSCARSAVGSVWCWGDNSNYQLGDGTNIRRETPVSVTGLAGVSTSKLAVSKETYQFACVLSSVGDIYCWGSNQGGRLGLAEGSYAESAAKVAGLGLASDVGVGEEGVCAVVDYSTWCWGNVYAGNGWLVQAGNPPRETVFP